MVPDKRVIENIKKLINLGMGEEEIISQLNKMGLNEDDAKELIDISKGVKKVVDSKKIKDTKTQEPEQPKEELLPKDLFKDDDIADIKNINEDKKEEQKDNDFDVTSGLNVDDFNKYIDNKDENTKKEEKTKNNSNDDFNLDKNYDINIDTTDKSSIWQSGLLTTLNTKLSEIEDKQKEIEVFVKKRIEEEINKYKKIQETTKQLLLTKIGEKLSEEKELVVNNVTKQLAQIKIEQAKLNKSISEIDTGKKEITEKVKELDTIKEKIVNDSEKVQTEIKKVAATTTVKINEKTKQINEILTLQSKISQGLIKNTKTAVENQIKDIKDFKERVESQINPKKLYDKLEELEKFKEQLANRYDTRFEAVKTEFLKKAHDAFKQKIENELNVFNEKLKTFKDIREEVNQKTDPELISKKIKELEIFEKQLINNIDEKITQSLKIYESGITQEFKVKINEFDEQIKKAEKHMLDLNAAKQTAKELNGFKDQFIAIIDKNIEKMNKTMSFLEEKIKEIE
jgi:hypothetical protein